jgi:hypothetical protein
MKYAKILVLLVICAMPSFGQANVGSFLSATSDKITTTNFYFARPNDLTIIVNVVGFVQRPGRYEIASNIDLMNLISLAGGPTSDGAMNKVKITRILKDGDRNRRKAIRIDLEDLATLKPEDLLLSPGDVVDVDRTSWSAFRDGMSVVISGAVIVSAVAQVINVVRR